MAGLWCTVVSLPLDFFSWHCYTADPGELVRRATAIRRLLDEYGFAKTESHLNEWNYLPGNTWKPLSKSSSAESRQRFYHEMAGAAGAAFIATALIELQDAPVDVCNLFHGELGGFGLFNEHGPPQHNFHALQAFAELLRCGRRVEGNGNVAGHFAFAAGLQPGDGAACVLLSHFEPGQTAISLQCDNLPKPDRRGYEVLRVDASHRFEKTEEGRLNDGKLLLQTKGPAVLLVRLLAR